MVGLALVYFWQFLLVISGFGSLLAVLVDFRWL